MRNPRKTLLAALVLLIIFSFQIYGQDPLPTPDQSILKTDPIEDIKSISIQVTGALSLLFWLFYLIVCPSLYSVSKIEYNDRFNDALEKESREKRNSLIKARSGDDIGNYREKISASLMLDIFRKQALTELNWNVKLSISISILGIAIIMTGVFLALLGLVPIGIASFASGTIIEAVSYLFYKRTDESRKRVQIIEQDLFKLSAAEYMVNDKRRDETIANIIQPYFEKRELTPIPNTSLLENKPVRRRMKLSE